MTTWAEWDEQRHESMLTSGVCQLLSPQARRLYIALYSPRQARRHWYALSWLTKWSHQRGIGDPLSVLGELGRAGLAVHDQLFDEVAFLAPDESAILEIDW